MNSCWCWSFSAGSPAANRWTLYGNPSSAIGGKHILAGNISCSCAANATAQLASFMRGIPVGITASGFSVAANALALPISPQWAIAGTAQRVVSRSCALGSNGVRTVPFQSSREVCTRGCTNVFWGCLPTTKPCESRARATLENTGPISTVPICGGNAETGLRALADGHRQSKKQPCPALTQGRPLVRLLGLG